MREFTSKDVYQILHIPQRTLDYWDERNVVKPSRRAAAGKGSSRKYTYDDLIELSVVKQLRQVGLSLQRIRKGLVYLRQTSRRPLRDVVLITDERDLFQKKKCGKLMSVLEGGQMVLGVVFLGKIPEEIDASIRSIEAERHERKRKARAKSA